MVLEKIKNLNIKQIFEVILCEDNLNIIKESLHFVTNKRVLAIVVVTGFSYYNTTYIFSKPYYREFCKKSFQKTKDFLFRKPPEDIEKQDNFVEYKFFDADQVDCRRHVVMGVPCEIPECAFFKLKYILNLLETANESVDLCMYLITCTDLAQALIDAHKKGVKVRVIVEEEMSTSSESKVQQLIHAGIVVKSKVLPTFMHHKFCLIDASVPYKRKLLTGSLNWTLQGLAGNWENIILLKHKIIVLKYLKEFNNIWNYFDTKPLKEELLSHQLDKTKSIVRTDDDYFAAQAEINKLTRNNRKHEPVKSS